MAELLTAGFMNEIWNSAEGARPPPIEIISIIILYYGDSQRGKIQIKNNMITIKHSKVTYTKSPWYIGELFRIGPYSFTKRASNIQNQVIAVKFINRLPKENYIQPSHHNIPWH